MTWRGSTTPLDRLFACLPYLLPLFDGLDFSAPFFVRALGVSPLANPLPPFMGLVVFFALFFLVVRNENISHFIRFNTMQAILLDIVIILCGFIINLVLLPALKGGLFLETIFNVIFLGTVIAVLYAVVQSALGRYAEIPTLSDAVHMQVR